MNFEPIHKQMTGKNKNKVKGITAFYFKQGYLDEVMTCLWGMYCSLMLEDYHIIVMGDDEAWDEYFKARGKS